MTSGMTALTSMLSGLGTLICIHVVLTLALNAPAYLITSSPSPCEYRAATSKYDSPEKYISSQKLIALSVCQSGKSITVHPSAQQTAATSWATCSYTALVMDHSKTVLFMRMSMVLSSPPKNLSSTSRCPDGHFCRTLSMPCCLPPATLQRAFPAEFAAAAPWPSLYLAYGGHSVNLKK